MQKQIVKKTTNKEGQRRAKKGKEGQRRAKNYSVRTSQHMKKHKPKKTNPKEGQRRAKVSTLSALPPPSPLSFSLKGEKGEKGQKAQLPPLSLLSVLSLFSKRKRKPSFSLSFPFLFLFFSLSFLSLFSLFSKRKRKEPFESSFACERFHLHVDRYLTKGLGFPNAFVRCCVCVIFPAKEEPRRTPEKGRKGAKRDEKRRKDTTLFTPFTFTPFTRVEKQVVFFLVCS